MISIPAIIQLSVEYISDFKVIRSLTPAINISLDGTESVPGSKDVRK
jgi:hypothetical protein